MNTSAQSTTPTSGSESSAQKSPCRAIFFRVFDLADFFDDPGVSLSNKRSIHFLEKRTGELSRCLFGYEVAESRTTPLYQDPWFKNNESDHWEVDKKETEREKEAYAVGWMRGTLRDLFFAPSYKFRKNLFDLIPNDSSTKSSCDIYRELWFSNGESISKVLGDTNLTELTLTLSPYGIVSVRLEVNVPIGGIVMGIGAGREFQCVQEMLATIFYSETALHKLKTDFRHAVDYPSWLSFIALSAIWQFLRELERKWPTNDSLRNWWGNLGAIKPFDEIWEQYTALPLPLRHEAAFYYFEHSRYEQNRYEHKPWGEAPTEIDLDCIIRLGLLVSSQQTSGGTPQELFAKDVRQDLDKKDLCVTDNGFAFVVGSSSLIVAVKEEEYHIQGSAVEESAYWRWMFRLLCCLRECFMLCDISSRDVRKLREQYESERALCFRDGKKATPTEEEQFEEGSRKLLDQLARVASLLFTVEEGTHAVAASRVPFVQAKFRTFVDHMELSDLLENINKRRHRLEERLHDEMSRILQGRMERLTEGTKDTAKNALTVSVQTKKIAKQTELYGRRAYCIAIGALIVAVVATWLSVWYARDLEGLVEKAVYKYVGKDQDPPHPGN